jgi:DNA topoisomerase-1
MTPAQLDQTTFIIVNSEALPAIEKEPPEAVRTAPFTSYEFRASGTIVRFDGFMALYTEGKDEIEEENGFTLPALKEDEPLRLFDVLPKQHFTQPPPRYTEATLVKTLEEKGIGRPSTYAAILSTVQDRKYVDKTDGRFSPTELGVVVNDYLVERFPELIDVGFTAKMEDELDHIEDGKMKWVKVVKDFYKPFNTGLTEAIKATGKIKPKDIPTEDVCEKCGLPMVIRWGRHGRFLACTGFPKCKNTKPLPTEGGEQTAPTPEALSQPTDERCEKCGSPMVIKAGRFGKFLACSRYPECKHTKPLATGIKCPDDGGDIVERRSKRGKQFWSCSNYPNCTFASWYRPVPQPCPQCGAEFILEKRGKGGERTLFCHKKECGYKEVEKAQEKVPAGVN